MCVGYDNKPIDCESSKLHVSSPLVIIVVSSGLSRYAALRIPILIQGVKWAVEREIKISYMLSRTRFRYGLSGYGRWNVYSDLQVLMVNLTGNWVIF